MSELPACSCGTHIDTILLISLANWVPTIISNSSLRWGGVGGEELFFNTTELGWETKVGTFPQGSMWRKCPLPRGPWGWSLNGASFEPVCEESESCKNLHSHSKKPKCLGPDKPCECKCSGDGIGDLPQLEIVDKVHLPATLAPGNYVLGWRWGEWVSSAVSSAVM